MEKVIVPELDFPAFPLAEEGSKKREGQGRISVPEEWIVELEKYHILIQSTEETYKAKKELYESFYGE